MVYECLRCSFKVKQKNDLRRHLNRKKICDVIICDISRQRCLEMLENNEDISKEYLKEQLRKKNDELISLRQELNNKTSKPDLKIDGDNNNVNIHNGNIYNIINLNPYAKTNYDNLVNDFVHYLENQDPKIKVPIFEGLIEKIHFNDDHPENQNVYKSNKSKDEYYILDEDGNFKMSTSDIPDDMIKRITKTLENNNIESERVVNLIKEHREESKEKEYIEATKKDIDTTLYNGRNKVKSTHKKLKKKSKISV